MPFWGKIKNRSDPRFFYWSAAKIKTDTTAAQPPRSDAKNMPLVYFLNAPTRQKMIQIVRRHNGRRILRSFFGGLQPTLHHENGGGRFISFLIQFRPQPVGQRVKQLAVALHGHVDAVGRQQVVHMVVR